MLNAGNEEMIHEYLSVITPFPHSHPVPTKHQIAIGVVSHKLDYSGNIMGLGYSSLICNIQGLDKPTHSGVG